MDILGRCQVEIMLCSRDASTIDGYLENMQ